MSLQLGFEHVTYQQQIRSLTLKYRLLNNVYYTWVQADCDGLWLSTDACKQDKDGFVFLFFLWEVWTNASVYDHLQTSSIYCFQCSSMIHTFSFLSYRL